MIKITFLGTSSAQPTKERAHPAVALDIGTETLLFDCGEGVQRQIKLARLKPSKIKNILLTHWHGDHVLGLPGLLQTFALNSREDKLTIYGPAGTKERFEHVIKGFSLGVNYKIDVCEAKSKSSKLASTDKYEIFSQKVEHPVPCIAYTFQERPKRKMNIAYLKEVGLAQSPLLKQLQLGKDITYDGKKITAGKATYLQAGKKLAYVIDAKLTSNLIKFVEGADILICEATFAGELQDSAEEYGHMTANDAATLAKRANVKKLIITHFSARYKDVKPLLDEAKKVFNNTIAAKDFLVVSC